MVHHDVYQHNGSLTSARTQAAYDQPVMCGIYACMARKDDDTVIGWGNINYGGSTQGKDLTNVAEAMCGGYACVARKHDNTAIAWGYGTAGTASGVDLTNVAEAMCGMYVCVARKHDNTAVAWGGSSVGGSTSGVDLTNVAEVMCGMYSCVARKHDNTAVAWGYSSRGGSASGVDLTNVAEAMCGTYVCVARKYDNTAVAWGEASLGGSTSGVDLTNVAYVMCNGACVARKHDNTAVAWGSSIYGGDTGNVDLTDIAIVEAQPTPAPAASATGDPHLQNIHGERFDLMRPGKAVLMQIPRGQPSEKSWLTVEADARRLGAQCADMYFQSLNITGAWADKLRAGGLTFTAGGSRDETLEAAQGWTRLGPLKLKVVHGRTSEGIAYLNFYVKHLREAGAAVGGLLGEDDYTEAATPEKGCRKSISLDKKAISYSDIGRTEAIASLA
jgi:hypothetical protein